METNGVGSGSQSTPGVVGGNSPSPRNFPYHFLSMTGHRAPWKNERRSLVVPSPFSLPLFLLLLEWLLPTLGDSGVCSHSTWAQG